MQTAPAFKPAERDDVYQALDRGIRHALGRAAAVERLRDEGSDAQGMPVNKRRKPFRWSALARFMSLPVLFVICVSPTVQSVFAERGNISAFVELGLMVFASGCGWWMLRDGAWSYREMCVGAYYGTLDKVTRNVLLRTIDISSRGENDSPEWLRVRDAQRWARWLTLAAMALAIMLAYAVCATILDCLWDAGWVTTVRPMSAFAVTNRVYEQVLWTLANSIPVLDLPGALHWADPAPFRDNLIVEAILFAARVMVFTPVVAWIITAYRTAGFDPRQPAISDEVADKVIRGLNTFERVTSCLRRPEDQEIASELIGTLLAANRAKGRPGEGRVDDEWEHAVNFASQALGEEWPTERVLGYLAALPTQSIR